MVQWVIMVQWCILNCMVTMIQHMLTMAATTMSTMNAETRTLIAETRTPITTNPSTARDRHGYGKTRGFSKTGSAGTGMVVNFGTPRYRRYVRVNYSRVSLISTGLKLFFLIFFPVKLFVSHRDTTEYGCASRAYVALTLTHSHPTSNKQSKFYSIY
jgi:hypothetical protein